jgi:hypothetical protein
MVVVLQTRNLRSQNEEATIHNPRINPLPTGWNGCVFGFYALKNLNSEYIFILLLNEKKWCIQVY